MKLLKWNNILQEVVNKSKRELTSLVDNLRDFLKTFDHASKCLQIPLPKPKVQIGSTKSKDILFAHYYNDIIEHPNRQIRLSLRPGINNSCVFSIKKFELPESIYSYRNCQPWPSPYSPSLHEPFLRCKHCEVIESNYDV